MMLKNEKGEIIPTERQQNVMDYETKRVINKEIEEEAKINSQRKMMINRSAQKLTSNNMVNFECSFIQNHEESKHSSMQNDVIVSKLNHNRHASGYVNSSSRSLSRLQVLKSNGSLKIDMRNVEGVVDHS